MEPRDPSFPAEPDPVEPLEAADYHEAILRLEVGSDADEEPGEDRISAEPRKE